jgi:hypothetical protein
VSIALKQCRLSGTLSIRCDRSNQHHGREQTFGDGPSGVFARHRARLMSIASKSLSPIVLVTPFVNGAMMP